MDRRTSRSGQIVLILAFILVGLTFLFLMVSDIFLAIRNKNRIQNAGDAAALMAARWQGITLNLLGELNLLHLAAACESNETAMAGIVALQERLVIVGPMIAVWASNETAKRNLEKITDPNGQAAAEMRVQADAVKEIARYWMNSEATSKAWPTKSMDCGIMLQTAIGSQSWAVPFAPNSSKSGYLLYDPAFYSNAGTKNWRWFCLTLFFDPVKPAGHDSTRAWLEDWNGWPSPPPPPQPRMFFDLGLRATSSTNFLVSGGCEVLLDMAREVGLDDIVTREAIEKNTYCLVEYPWYCFDNTERPDMGTRWRPLWELEKPYPLHGRVKDEYNVKGAIAKCDVFGDMVPVTEIGKTNVLHWAQGLAAKPFGDYMGRSVIDLMPAPSLVVPFFHFVRLMPSASDRNQGPPKSCSVLCVGTDHFMHVYNGSREDGCPGCDILNEWPALSREGAKFLREHSHEDYCVPPASGSGGQGGGISPAY